MSDSISHEDDTLTDHLVFFIHGMGQQYEKYGNMKHHVSTMEKNTTELLTSHYSDQKMRIKYIPIEWHSKVHQFVDTKINKSTLNTAPKMRLAANEWLMDCLYYFSKPYGQYIIDSVCEQCNSAYLELNNFKGDVHFIGFSLGGIIAYDVATMQWLQEDGCPPWKESDVECQKPDIHVPPLNFKIRSLFTCGSPIAAGLICRGLDYNHYHPPSRTRIYNIFHPFDPLGYRLEPLIHSKYELLDPIQIERLPKKSPNLGIITGAKSIWQYYVSKKKRKEDELFTHEEEKKEVFPRMDYVLTENTMDTYVHEWIVALKSHFRYWANRDVTLHIIKVLINEES